MSGYIGPKPGELQEKILNHFFECKSKRIERIDHISKAIDAIQPSVSRSIDRLLEDKYLVEDPKRAREKGNKFFEKAIYVTDKGAAYAVVMLDVKLEQIKNYNAKYDSASAAMWNQYCEIFAIPEKREYIFRKSMEFLLANDLFDGEGRIRNQLTEEEIQKMKMSQFTASKEYYESVGLGNQGITNFNEFLDKYKIDKDSMKKYLLYKKQEINSALNQIDNSTADSNSTGNSEDSVLK